MSTNNRPSVEAVRAAKPPTEDMPAYFEAAIAVAAYHAGIPIRYATIAESRGEHVGHCAIDGGTLFADLADGRESDAAWLSDLATAMEAGIALDRIWSRGVAESVVLPQGFLITQLCLKLLLSLQEAAARDADGREWSDVERVVSANKWQQAVWAGSHNVVLSYWDQIQRVAGELLRLQTLTRDEIAAIIEES